MIFLNVLTMTSQYRLKMLLCPHIVSPRCDWRERCSPTLLSWNWLSNIENHPSLGIFPTMLERVTTDDRWCTNSFGHAHRLPSSPSNSGSPSWRRLSVRTLVAHVWEGHFPPTCPVDSGPLTIHFLWRTEVNTTGGDNEKPGAMYSTTGTSALYTAGAGATLDVAGAGAMYSATGASAFHTVRARRTAQGLRSQRGCYATKPHR